MTMLLLKMTTDDVCGNKHFSIETKRQELNDEEQEERQEQAVLHFTLQLLS